MRFVKRKELRAAAEMVRKHAGSVDCAIVLGSGIGGAFDRRLTDAMSYDAVPGMPTATVAGHAGRILFGSLGARSVIAFSGRFHPYEGYEPRDVTYPIALAAAAGAKTCILTNAAGGLTPALAAGDLMLIVDHLNLSGSNPLAGPHPIFDARERFVEMIDAYDPVLRDDARRAASADGIALREGVYAAVPGPTYETPAEAEMLRRMGADAVGMSTVLETIAARALGLRIAAISVITNVVGVTTTHDEVLAQSASAADRLALLIERMLTSKTFE